MEFLVREDANENSLEVSRVQSAEVHKAQASPAEGALSVVLRPRTPLLDTDAAINDGVNGSKESSCEKFAIKRASHHFDDDDDGRPVLDSSRQKLDYNSEGFDFNVCTTYDSPQIGGIGVRMNEDDQTMNQKEEDGEGSTGGIDINLSGESNTSGLTVSNEIINGNSLGDARTQNDEETTEDQDQEQNAAAPAREETEDERISRELRESEALAWQMMQQEADNAYHMQLEYMRNNADNMSAEDYAALTQIVQESAVPQVAPPPRQEDEEEHNEDDSADSSAAWEDPNNYDRLLALGSHIGDVKTERWRLRCKEVIARQPRVSFRDIVTLLDDHVAGSKSSKHKSDSTHEGKSEGTERGGAQTALGSMASCSYGAK